MSLAQYELTFRQMHLLQAVSRYTEDGGWMPTRALSYQFYNPLIVKGYIERQDRIEGPALHITEKGTAAIEMNYEIIQRDTKALREGDPRRRKMLYEARKAYAAGPMGSLYDYKKHPTVGPPPLEALVVVQELQDLGSGQFHKHDDRTGLLDWMCRADLIFMQAGQYIVMQEGLDALAAKPFPAPDTIHMGPTLYEDFRLLVDACRGEDNKRVVRPWKQSTYRKLLMRGLIAPRNPLMLDNLSVAYMYRPLTVRADAFLSRSKKSIVCKPSVPKPEKDEVQEADEELDFGYGS